MIIAAPSMRDAFPIMVPVRDRIVAHDKDVGHDTTGQNEGEGSCGQTIGFLTPPPYLEEERRPARVVARMQGRVRECLYL
jgi:hypothetical protein